MSDEYQTTCLRFLKEKLKRLIENNLDDDIRSDTHNVSLFGKNKKMRFEHGIYSPEVDIAVGPFAFRAGSYDTTYNRLLRDNHIKRFIDLMGEKGKYLGSNPGSKFDGDALSQNRNPRCFLALEIENKTSRKHFMGSVLNSSIMGKIGILIYYDNNKADRIFKYFKEVISREKIIPIMKNVLWIKKKKFDEFMRNYK